MEILKSANNEKKKILLYPHKKILNVDRLLHAHKIYHSTFSSFLYNIHISIKCILRCIYNFIDFSFLFISLSQILNKCILAMKYVFFNIRRCTYIFQFQFHKNKKKTNLNKFKQFYYYYYYFGKCNESNIIL